MGRKLSGFTKFNVAKTPGRQGEARQIMAKHVAVLLGGVAAPVPGTSEYLSFLVPLAMLSSAPRGRLQSA
jgi:hypothetical protein